MRDGASGERVRALALANAPLCELAAADLDDDGDDELLVLERAGEATGLVALSLGTGAPLWAAVLGTASDAGLGPHAPVVLDLEGDGVVGVLVASGREGPRGGYTLALLDGRTGDRRWERFWFGRHAGESTIEGAPSRVRLARFAAGSDADGDGQRDVLAVAFHRELLFVTCLSGADGRTLWWWCEPALPGPVGELGTWPTGPDGLPRVVVAYDNEERRGRRSGSDVEPRIADLDGGLVEARGRARRHRGGPGRAWASSHRRRISTETASATSSARARRSRAATGGCSGATPTSTSACVFGCPRPSATSMEMASATW